MLAYISVFRSISSRDCRTRFYLLEVTNHSTFVLENKCERDGASEAELSHHPPGQSHGFLSCGAPLR